MQAHDHGQFDPVPMNYRSPTQHVQNNIPPTEIIIVSK